MTKQPSTAIAAAGLAVAVLAIAACTTSAPAPRKTITVTVTPSQFQSTVNPGGPSPTPTSASPVPAAAAACLTRYLNGTTGAGQGAAGSTYVNIVFKNLQNVPCTLYGFPGVAQAAGTPVTDIGKPSVESTTSTRELVTLPPGGFAYATLRITNAGNFSPADCTIKPATWLEVIPPNQRVPLNIPFKSQACEGSAQVLTVTAVRPGTGG